MVNNCVSVAGFCIVSVILSILLRQYNREQSLMLSLCVCAGVLISSMYAVGTIIEELTEIFSQAGISQGFIDIIFKAAAISIITHITCEICRESNEYAIASASEFYGRIALIYISIPVLKEFLETVKELI